MNQDQAKGRWDLIKGRTKVDPDLLSEDDFRATEDHGDDLFGIIQREKLGDRKTVIQARPDTLYGK